ncbi:hypothetical protein GCM10023223_41480 [Stackebrandtia albiflava]
MAVLLVLAVAIGLTLSMLVAGEAVAGKLAALRDDMDTTITVRPGFGPEVDVEDVPTLGEAELAAVSDLPHVTEASATVSAMLETPQPEEEPEGTSSAVQIGPGASFGTTDLKSGMDPDTVGAPEGVAFPISLTGVTGDRDSEGVRYDLVEGELPDGAREAVISDKIAEANGLGLGDTFTAFDEEFEVVGVAESGDDFDSVGVVMTAETVRELSEVEGFHSFAIDVDDPDHIASVQEAVVAELGAAFEVHSQADSVMQASAGLETVEDITSVGFWVSLGSAAVIVFFTLAMTVRERRREVGVIKAIGGTDRGVIAQFGVEAVVLVSLATVLGMGVAAASSDVIADVLVATNSTAAEDTDGGQTLSGTGGKTIRVTGPGQTIEGGGDLIGEVTAGIGPRTIGVGALAALGIALLGSAVPAYLIARVRPAEVLRGE